MTRAKRVVVLSALVLVIGSLTSLAATAGGTVSDGRAVPTCFGMAATIVGTNAGEILNGTAGADVIVGRGGGDTINGLGGKDRLCGDGGNDTIQAGPGNDKVQGGLGNDTLAGEAGNDSLNGGPGTDTVTGGPGTDTCYGETKVSCELPVDKVTGTYGYVIGPGPDGSREVTVSAQGTDPVAGTWSWSRPSDSWNGPVTCLRVNGADAWLAGPMENGTGAVFLFVHDGGTSGGAGDTAFTWGTDPGETLDDMEALCDSMTPPPFYGFDPFSVVSGNVKVTDIP